MFLQDEDLEFQFNYFKTLVQKHTDGEPFRSFNEGLPHDWEGYKPRLRDHALSKLDLESWNHEQIGTGIILEALIAAVEVNPDGERPGNNLVAWQNRFGHAARSHRKLLNARHDDNERRKLEAWAFGFFRGQTPDPDAFETLCELAGRRYDLAGYLFFLKDMDRFMPIRPKTFDLVFGTLSIDLTLNRNCSWDNYNNFVAALAEIQSGLSRLTGEDVRLVDAHSFCWMLEQLPHAKVPSAQNQKKSKKDPGHTLGARDLAIVQMASTAEQIAKQSGRVVAESIAKTKELRMPRQQLEQQIRSLLDIQENRCALSGIVLHFGEDGEDDELRASLDRIDSDGHYEENNLQVVCRFINKWKSDTQNEEFCRLLELVRDNQDPDSG